MKISAVRQLYFATAAILPTYSSAFHTLSLQPLSRRSSSPSPRQKNEYVKNITPQKQFHQRRQTLSTTSSLFAENKKSYDFNNNDSTTERKLMSPPPPTHAAPPINGSSSSSSSSSSPPQHKYHSLLTSVGLDGKLSRAPYLPRSRIVTSNDIFCNRELKLDAIRAIGFDMDYTLAQYQQPSFDKLAFDGAKEKLVTSMGYPREVLDCEYDHAFWVRGLIIDTVRGNFLKIDRHKYVRLAYHGFDRIDSNTRKVLYSRSFNKIPSFSERQFVNMDTLFQHVDAHLFAHLIDMKDKGDSEFLDMKTYGEIYKQIRECVDLCHRDGVIKDEVARNPDKYIVKDDRLVPMLKEFREAGVKVFLLTNSYWEYTSVAMNYLYHQRKVEDDLKKKNEWLELFDLVVVGSCKPAYLIDPYLNLFRVNPQDGSLLNTDGLYEIDALGENGAQKFLDRGKVFQGGNWKHLQAMLETKAGEEIFYVGDHLYADVLRSKRTLGWRTGLIVPEISKEMEVFSSKKELSKQIAGLRKLRDELGYYADTLRNNLPPSPDLEEELTQLTKDDEIVKETLAELAAQYHAAFHPIWGQMFLSGYQDSRFAFYVQNYACVYTSRATNLGLVSMERSFRTSGEMLPHDKLLLDANSEFQKVDLDG